MPSPAITTVVKIMESLPIEEQDGVIEHLKKTRCATKNGKKEAHSPRVLENRTNVNNGEQYVFYRIFYHCRIL